ncbi:MAG: sarcosine oxidase subunit beta family protein [Gammaproteobacteria bacterium]|nr:MAG: sarcosine oxidase subunit beta family protein [Gammaproteobacteria bacterium]TLZ05851.1 MAG: sarcosine oxidase subunit beta family protein [Gammaproteobacteria bacterium]TLZ40296.1 MAG: sarcosine oxidase subunit beta family protein [Gammaproteobacteria bacterium]
MNPQPKSHPTPARARRVSSGRYSLWRVFLEGLTGQRGWSRAWAKATPRERYRVVIVGGGGHGLATAFYLATEYGISDVAVLEQGPLGLGNVGRNTTIIRSNYFHPQNIRFYEHSLKLWEGLERALNFNAMVSQRGTLNLFHSEAQRDLFTRRANMMRLLGVDAEALSREAVKELVPLVDLDNGRYPVLGGFLQRRGGTVRHDAVAWGYARAASEAGVDIVEDCEVTGITRDGSRVTGVETTRGHITADTVCLAVAGHSSRLAAMAGLTLPIESHVLQAFVSEGIKPVLDVVLTYGAGHFYVSQSDKGGLVFGGAIDGYNSYGQRGTLPMAEEVAAAAVTLLPGLARLKVLRQWGGVMDMSMDGSPIISATPLEGLFVNGGWCYGGFKAIPAGGLATAHLIARQAPHPLAAHLGLERFAAGRTVDERGAGPFPYAH